MHEKIKPSKDSKTDREKSSARHRRNYKVTLIFKGLRKKITEGTRSPTVQQASLACIFLVSSHCANFPDAKAEGFATILYFLSFSFFTYGKGLTDRLKTYFKVC